MGVLLDDIKGVVVHGNHEPGIEQLDGIQRVIRPHSEVVADGKQSYVNGIALSDQLHVVEQTRIGSVVNGLATGLDDEATGIATIAAIG